MKTRATNRYGDTAKNITVKLNPKEAAWLASILGARSYTQEGEALTKPAYDLYDALDNFAQLYDPFYEDGEFHLAEFARAGILLDGRARAAMIEFGAP